MQAGVCILLVPLLFYAQRLVMLLVLMSRPSGTRQDFQALRTKLSTYV